MILVIPGIMWQFASDYHLGANDGQFWCSFPIFFFFYDPVSKETGRSDIANMCEEVYLYFK